MAPLPVFQCRFPPPDHIGSQRSMVHSRYMRDGTLQNCRSDNDLHQRTRRMGCLLPLVPLNYDALPEVGPSEGIGSPCVISHPGNPSTDDL